MAKEFLTQDEVDALLKGVSGELEPEAEKPEDNQGIRPYNIATQERIVRGRMPTLEIINERFARLMRVALFNFIRRSAEISVGPVRVQKYSEFIRNLVVPTNLNVVQVKPLRGSALFIFDPNLVFLVVDNLFGGDGRFHTRVEGREFTQTELRIIQKLLEVVFENYEKSWSPVYPVKFEHTRSEMHTQFASIATPNEVVVTTTFTIELGAVSGDFHLCLPYAMIEPIRDILYSSLQGDHVEADKRWVRLLSRQVQSAEVELVANLGSAKLSLRQVNGLKIGDVIPLDIPAELTAEIDGVPVMECNYGVFNGQYALRVQRMINQGLNDRFTGQEDV
ncbi:MAG TPA: flagellar motor switch protein FliM [Burkholderiales bacterium]|nr:flagellar motor switch protein FliM [Burkholderiales bacterium]